MAEKKLTIRVSAEDAASGIFGKIAGNAEELEHKIKNIGKAAGTRSFAPLQELFGAGAKLGVGGFALAGATIGAEFLERAAKSVEELSIAYRDGEKTQSEFIDDAARSIPVFGSIYGAFREGREAIEELITGDKAYLAQVSNAADIEEQAWTQRKKLFDDATSAADAYYKSALRVDQQTYTFKASAQDKPFVQAGYEFRNQADDARAKLDADIKKQSDAAADEIKKLRALQSGDATQLESYLRGTGLTGDALKAASDAMAKDDRFQKIRSAKENQDAGSNEDLMARALAGASLGGYDVSASKASADAITTAGKEAADAIDKAIREVQSNLRANTDRMKGAATIDDEARKRNYDAQIAEFERQKIAETWSFVQHERVQAAIRASQTETSILEANGHDLAAQLKSLADDAQHRLDEAVADLLTTARDPNSTPEQRFAKEQAVSDAKKAMEAAGGSIADRIRKDAERGLAEEQLAARAAQVDGFSTIEDRKRALDAELKLKDMERDQRYEDRQKKLDDAIAAETDPSKRAALQAQRDSLAGDKAAESAFDRRNAIADATARLPQASALADYIEGRGNTGLALRAQEQAALRDPFASFRNNSDTTTPTDKATQDTAAGVQQTNKLLGDLIGAVKSITPLSAASF